MKGAPLWATLPHLFGRLVRCSAPPLGALSQDLYMFFIELKSESEVGYRVQGTFECKISEKQLGYREHLNAKSQIGGQHKISEGGTKSHDDGESGEMELS